jgi:hypothetical protein
VKVEINKDLYVPFNEREKIFKWTPHNIKAQKIW